MVMTDGEYAAQGGCLCPSCDSEDIEGGSVSFDAGCAWREVGCNSCGAHWNDLYTLTGYSDLEKEGDVY